MNTFEGFTTTKRRTKEANIEYSADF